MGSGVSKDDLEKQHVVVIGAGYGGVQAAASLKKFGVPFKIIDPKDFFHHCVGSLRASVVPEFGKKIMIPLKEAFGGSFIQGKVQTLDTENKRVVLEDGQDFEFTHCIVAVGSLGPVPARTNQTTMDGLTEEYKGIAIEIAKAKKIVIVGGGPVGVEMAGEIRDVHKETEITLVSSCEELVSKQFNDKFQNRIRDVLKGENIKVEIGRAQNLKELKLNVVEEQEVVLDNENKIPADLVICAIGLPPNSDMAAKLLPDKMDDNKRIKVNEFMQVEGFDNIYCIGDCCNTEENKMAAYADAHGATAANNIVNSVGGRKLAAYRKPFEGMLIPMGPSHGLGFFNGYIIPDMIASMLKSKDLFVGKFWGNVGLKAPA